MYQLKLFHLNFKDFHWFTNIDDFKATGRLNEMVDELGFLLPLF